MFEKFLASKLLLLKYDDLISVTYKNVLNANREGNNNVYMVCYGTDNDHFWHDSKDLVFGIRYDEFVDNGLGQDDKWLNNYYKQKQLLGDCVRELESECKEILGIDVYFLKYDDVSVMNSMVRRDK